MGKLKKSPRATDNKSTRGRPRKAPARFDDEDTSPEIRGTEKEDLALNQHTPVSVATKANPSSQTPSAPTAKVASPSWADIVAAETEAEKRRTDTIKVHQNPNFTLHLDESVASAGTIEFTDDELHEASKIWKFTLIGCVVGTEVNWVNMEKFVRAKWKGIQSPTIVKRNGTFLFQFYTQEDMNKVYEASTFFIFDHPLLLKKYEPGMRISRDIFDLSVVWIRLPGLKLELWQPNLISKLVSAIGNPLMADQATIQKSRLEYARILVQLHEPENLKETITYGTPDGEQLQIVEYEWNPTPCSKCNRWGHHAKECDPNHGSKMRAARLQEQSVSRQDPKSQPLPKPQHTKQPPTKQPHQAVWQTKDKGKSKKTDVTEVATTSTNLQHISPSQFSSLDLLKGADNLEDVNLNLIPY